MRKHLFLILGLLLHSGIYAEDVTTYTPGADEGIVYFLPKTGIEVNAIVTKEVYTPGEFCQYAKRYLRLNDIETKAKTSWALKAVEVKAIAIPDSTKAFIIKSKDRSLLSNVQLTHNGIIKAINANEIKTDQNKQGCMLEKKLPTEDGKKYLTEEILMAGSSAKMAELVAKEIYNIRESRNLILRGQVDAMPKDQGSLELVINNLNKQEKALLQMFSGTVSKEDKAFKVTVMPKVNMQNEIIFRFSKRLGMLDQDDLAGEPIYFSMKDITPTQTKSLTKEEKKKGLEGAIYNVPGIGKVSVSYQGKNLIIQDFSIAQFGTTESLPYALFNKKFETRITFNPLTGGIVKIEKEDR